MSINKFTRYLTGDGNFFSGFAEGALKAKGDLANWQHATRVFLDANYRLSPRHKFLYYIVFEIDPTSHNATAFTAKHAQEVGFLCKTVELPKFNFDTVTKNQYNRKKLIYKSINYDPVNITMHDDSQGIINSLWAIYYGTYVADRQLPSAAYSATHLRNGGIATLDQFRYGLDNDKSVDFFKSISVYTMSRSRFNGYTLVNPRIQSWTHGNVDYADGGLVESSMSIQYEAVRYSTGSVKTNSPKGFATLHYDTAPSPISVAGGGVANLLGQGGVLDGVEQIFGDIAGGSTFDSPQGFLSTAIKSINTYKNLKSLSIDSLKQEAKNILNSPGAASGIVNTVGGIVGSIFPKNSPAGDTTTASSRNLTEG